MEYISLTLNTYSTVNLIKWVLLEIYGIKATEFNNAFTVTITNTETGNATVVTYSVNDYVKDKLSSDISDNVGNLCKAIYLYGVASETYFG